MTPPLRTFTVVALSLAGALGCAPSSVAPMVIRMSPGDPARPGGLIGLRTGPRVSVPVAPRQGFGNSGFAGDTNTFALPQWSLAYDFGLVRPVAGATALHFGVQGEFYYPFPLPGYGAYVGASHLWRVGRFIVSPALAVRGATDFGLPTIGGPGSFAGAELSLSLGWAPEEKVALGIVPFVSAQHLWAAGTGVPALYAGAVLVGHVEIGTDTYELLGGFGRVFMPDVRSWGSPILGVRVGR